MRVCALYLIMTQETGVISRARKPSSEALGRKGVFPGFDRLGSAAVGWFTL